MARNWRSRSAVVVLVALATLLIPFALSSNVYAFELKASELKGSSKKKPVNVLQNRFFLKKYRPEIGLITGSFLNEAYTKTSLNGARVSFFFNEWVGAEVQYYKTSVKETDDKKALNNLEYRDLEEDKIVTPDPETNPVYGGYDINAVVAPLYGKMNVFNKFIIYSDLYISGGISRVDTRQGEITSTSIGLGERFYMAESFSVRIDFRDRIYTETRNDKSSRKNALSIDLGVSYFLL